MKKFEIHLIIKHFLAFREFFSACDDSESDDNCVEENPSEEQIVTYSDENIENEDTKWLDNYFASFDDDVQVNFIVNI